MKLLTFDYGALLDAVWTLKGGVVLFVVTLGVWPVTVLLFGLALVVTLLVIDVVLLLPIRLATGAVARPRAAPPPTVRVRIVDLRLPHPDPADRLPPPRWP